MVLINGDLSLPIVTRFGKGVMRESETHTHNPQEIKENWHKGGVNKSKKERGREIWENKKRTNNKYLNEIKKRQRFG